MAGFLCFLSKSNAQCPLEPTGQNMVQNPSFEEGDVSFNSSLDSWNDPSNGVPCSNPDPTTCSRNYSLPGEYWVSNDPDEFNPDGFSTFPAHSGTNMLMIDANCTPGQVVWEQVVEVVPNSNYYFSVFIASLKSISPARLRFEVDGVTLGTEVNAPSTRGIWIFYEDTWNSGSVSGQVTLRIKEQNGSGCADGDDFALDDISFIKGCQFGSSGPEPDLGPDRTFCGTTGTITLDPQITEHPNITFTWSTGETSPTISITEPGKYSVCVDSGGSCIKSDVIEIFDDYNVNLGGDVNLCDPTEVTLTAAFGGQYVTYQWLKDGVYIDNEREASLWVNEPGVYTVEVRDPICGLRSDQWNISTSTAAPVNADFCAPSTADLSVNGTGKYAWYDAPEGGNKIGEGNTFTTPELTETTMYYVADTTAHTGSLGPVSSYSGGYGNGAVSNKWIEFEAYTDVTLDQVTVYPVWVNSSMTVGIMIYDITNSYPGTLVSSITTNINVANNTSNPSTPIQIPVDVNLQKDRRYRITNEGTSGGQLWYHDGSSGSPNFPYTISGVMSITGLSSAEQYSDYLYGYFYDWKITYHDVCNRVPVRARAYCEPSCETPSTVILDPWGPLDLCGGTQLLTATPVPAYSYQYQFLRDDVTVQTASLVNTYMVADSGFYRVIVSDPTAPDLCSFPSAWVYFSNSGLVGDAVNLDGPANVCANETATFTLPSVENATDYIWEIPAGATIVSSSGDTLVEIQFGTSSGYVKVTPSNRCSTGSPDSLSVSVYEELPNAGPISVSNPELCETDTVTFSIPGNALAESYTWTIPGNSTLIADNGISIDVQLGTTTGYVTVYPSNYCGDGPTDSLYLDVTPLPLPATSLTGPQRVCENQTYTFSLEAVGNAESYIWQVPAGSIITGGDGTNSITLEMGSSSGDIIVTPANSCGSGIPDTLSVEIVPPSEDAADILGEALPCEADTITYTTTFVVNAETYTWTVPSGAVIISQVDTAITVVLGASSGFVTVTPSSLCGAGIPDSLPIQVSPLVTPSVSIPDPGPVCEESIVNLNALVSNGGTNPILEWYVNGIPQNNNTYSFTSEDLLPGDTVSVELVSTERCLRENPVHTTLILQELWATISDDTTTCFPDSVLLDINTNGAINWFRSPSIELGHTDDSLYVFNSGYYFAEISYDVCKDTIGREVYIYIPTVHAKQDTTITLGHSAEFFALPFGVQPFQYRWTNKNDQILSTDSTLSVTPILIGGGTETYYVSTVDSNGCIASDSVVVIVIHPDLLIPNLITPNNDGHNDTFVVKGILPESQLWIYNRWGDLVYHSNDYQNDWNKEDVSDGIYYWKLILGITGTEHKGWLHVLTKTELVPGN